MSDCAAVSFATTVPHGGSEWPLVRSGATDHGEVTPLAASVGSLSVCDAEPPENANDDRPWVLRTRFTLHLGERSAAFHLDRALASALRAGDTLRIAGTRQCGLGVAAFRNGQLVAAVGAVTAVLCRGAVTVRVAPDLWEDAVSLHANFLGEEESRRTFRNELPVEVVIAGHRSVWFRRNETIHGVHVFVKHGFRTRSPRDECVALARIGLCSPVSATTSAYLLAADDLTVAP